MSEAASLKTSHVLTYLHRVHEKTITLNTLP